MMLQNLKPAQSQAVQSDLNTITDEDMLAARSSPPPRLVRGKLISSPHRRCQYLLSFSLAFTVVFTKTPSSSPPPSHNIEQLTYFLPPPYLLPFPLLGATVKTQGSGPAGVVDLNSLIPATDISTLTAPIIKQLSSAQWKERKEGLDAAEAMLNAAQNRIQPKVT